MQKLLARLTSRPLLLVLLPRSISHKVIVGYTKYDWVLLVVDPVFF
jgi:hypothetical protein